MNVLRALVGHSGTLPYRCVLLPIQTLVLLLWVPTAPGHRKGSTRFTRAGAPDTFCTCLSSRCLIAIRKWQHEWSPICSQKVQAVILEACILRCHIATQYVADSQCCHDWRRLPGVAPWMWMGLSRKLGYPTEFVFFKSSFIGGCPFLLFVMWCITGLGDLGGVYPWKNQHSHRCAAWPARAAWIWPSNIPDLCPMSPNHA